MSAGDPQLTRVRRFYDEWTPKFLAGFGTTFQAGLLKEQKDAPEDPRLSACLLAKRAGIKAGDRVLDAGCGIGGPAVAIASGMPGVRIAGITVSGVQASLGNALVTQAGLEGFVSITRGDFHELPFASGSFDVAYLFEASGYSQDRPRLFRELARVVRPGGRIYVKDVFARPPPVSDAEQRDLDEFDRLWCLAGTPTIPEIEVALSRAGCQVLASGPLLNVGNASFLRAMFDLDAETIFRMNELGEAFALRVPDLPTFFGEVSALVGA